MSDMAALSPSWIQPLGWALIQFLWQGTLIAVLFAAARACAGRWLTAQGRYVLACAALAVMTAAPVLTFVTGPRLAPGASATTWPLASASGWRVVMPWLVAAWACGVMVFSIRLIGGWRFTSRLRSAGVGPAPVEWQEALDRLVRRLAVTRPVRLLVSSLVDVPSVVGWVRPVILMPVGALTGLPADHVAALLAHELAHVRRHDYLVNVLQRSVEALLFYHPAVWWMSGQIRAEREMCCDDLAVAAHGDALTYARALADLESSRRAHRSEVLAASGASLVARIRRLLGQGHGISHMLPGPAAIAVMSVLWLIGIGALTAHGATSVTTAPPDVAAAAAGEAQPAARHATHAETLLSTVLLGPIGPSPAPQAQQPSVPSAPVSGAPGATNDPRRDPSEIPQTGTGVIRGTVVRADTLRPLRQVRVTLRASGVRDLPVAMTDDKGGFELKELPPGRFTLTAAKGGFVTLEHGQRRASEPGRPIELADGEVIERVDLQLPAGGAISGVVLDESGEPLAGASVQAQRRSYAGGRPQPVPTPASVDITDDLGQFRLFGLPPGSYYVSAEASRSPLGTVRAINIGGGATFYPGKLVVSEAAPVPVNAGEEITSLSFPVLPPRTAVIRGVVRTEGRLPGDIRISVGQVTNGGTSLRSVSVRSDGAFSIPDLSPGSYSVTALLPPPADQVASEQVVLQGADALVVLTLRKAPSVHGRVTFETVDAKSSLQPSSVRIRLEGDATPTLAVAFGGLRVNDDWTFEATGLMGRQRLRPSLPPGWAVKSIRLGGRDVTDSPIEFGPGDIDDLEVQLTQRLTNVAGFVSDSRGQLITDAIVVLFADDRGLWGPGTRFVRTARPDQQGRFQIQGLPPARYTAVALDFLETGEESNPDTLERLRKLGTTVRLSEGEARALDLRVSRAP